MEGISKYDSTHKHWGQAIQAYPDMDPAETLRMWAMIDALDAEREARRARQAAGLEPPDDYPMVPEQMPPVPLEEVQRVAEELCGMLEECGDNWRRLGKQIRTTIWGDAPPPHRPPSSFIAKRNERIVEQIEYWRAQRRRQMKTILHDLGKRYGLSTRAVRKIWDARERKVT